MAIEINYEEIKDLFNYNPDTGIISWRISKGNKKSGDEAGTFLNGYRTIRFNGQRHQAHRIAYCLHHKSIDSKLYIDHIDGHRSNNKISNLRLVTNQNNQYNKKIMKNNTSGYNGVTAQKRKYKRNDGEISEYIYYTAMYMFDNKLKGKTFKNIEDAIKFRKEIDKTNHMITDRHGKKDSL